MRKPQSRNKTNHIYILILIRIEGGRVTLNMNTQYPYKK